MEQKTTHTNPMTGKSQNALILQYLLKGKRIDNKKSHHKPFYCENLQARIWDLRHLHNIDIKSKRLPRTTTVEYYLEKEEIERLCPERAESWMTRSKKES